MKILIGADLVPTDSNVALFEKGDVEELVGTQLLEVLKAADYRIFNLEVPLTDAESPIAKCGPALIAPTAAIAGYQALNANLLTLGNNHIMDQGEQGLFSTMQTLDAQKIGWIGAGDCRQKAAQPRIVEIGLQKIGIYACAEHEFSIAGEETPGANPIDLLETPDHVAQLKQQCDYVIVLYHGGKEHYRYPSPMLQKTCRKLVEKGADLVVCQHSHCIGCEEKYQNGTIVYGQGNFLFDHSKSEYWQTALLVQVEDGKVSYIPLVKTEHTVRLAQGQAAQQIMDNFTGRSEEIKDPKAVQKRYDAFARSMHLHYVAALTGVNTRSFFFRVANKLTGGKFHSRYLERKYDKKKQLVVQNFIECEAHRELLLSGLKEN